MKIETILKYFNPDYWKINKEILSDICYLDSDDSYEELIIIVSEYYSTTVEIRTESNKYVRDIRIVTDRIRYLTYGTFEDVYLEKDKIYFITKILNWVENPLQMKLDIFEAYTKTFKSFLEKEGKIIEKYGFEFWEDGMFGSGSDVYYFTYYSHESKCYLEFSYDILSDDILLQYHSGLQEISTMKNFEENLREWFAEDERTEYLVSNDPKHTKYTHKYICLIKAEIDKYIKCINTGTELSKIANIDIDSNHIPEKYKEYYNYFLDIKNEQLIKETNAKKD